jgi:uncharacterized phage protein (TIGR02218 family)
MKLVTPALAAHFGRDIASLAMCWAVEKKDGTVLRGTDHDEDIEIDEDSPPQLTQGLFLAGSNITASDVRSTADSAVDNMEATGAIPTTPTAPGDVAVDITVADIEAGLYDGAPVTMFVVNWEQPNDGVLVIRHGYLGQIRRDSDGKYTSELRGLKQLLQQVFVRTFSERCQVKRFGDAECKFPLETVRQTGTVTAVTNAKRFDASIAADSPAPAGGYYNGGELMFTSGDNAGYFREIKRDDNDAVIGHLSFWERFPNDPQVGDTFEVTPGCDRLLSTCRDRYENVVNFRGYGVFIQGVDALTKGPT